MRKASTLPRRASATALAVFAHLMALLVLGWQVPRLAGPPPAKDHEAAVEVTLVRPQARPEARPRSAASRPAPASPRPAPRVLVAPTPGAPALSAPPPAQNPPPAASPDEQNLRNALRGLTACADPDRLKREEREACDKRLAAARPAAVAPQFSAEERAQFDPAGKQDPIFVRKPHNGCLPRIGDRPTPSAAAAPSGATTTFGLGCGWSF